MITRVCCPNCKKVQNLQVSGPCTSCQTPISVDGEGMLRIYRKGSPIGIAVGYGLYLNGQPMGHLANMETIQMPVPAGHYTLRMTCGATRRCQEASFDVHPGELVCLQGRIKPGFWTNSIIVEVVPPSAIPNA